MLDKLFKRNRENNDPFRAQGKEDKLIAALLNLEKSGFYIDVGAHHPIALSNTYYLYQAGWRGICIEPNEDLIDYYKQHRPHDIIYNIAVASFEGEADFYLGQYDVHSSLQENENTNVSRRKVSVRRLDNILEERGQSNEIDLLSVDTEGTEVDVLEGLNLYKNRPRLILAEYNTADRANSDLQPYLIEKGYQVIFVNKWNILFARDFSQSAIHLYNKVDISIRSL